MKLFSSAPESRLLADRNSRSEPPRGIGLVRWGTERELAGCRGLIVGKSKRWGLLRAEGAGHFLTIAPTRSGKGVGSIVPNLLTYPGSVVVLDPKRENYAITANSRKAMGQRVHAFDPFGIAAVPEDLAAYNPFDALDVRPAMLPAEAAALADLLVLQGTTRDPFWNLEASDMVAGLIAHVATSGAHRRFRTLDAVRGLLTLPTSGWRETVEKMAASDIEVVRRAGGRIQQKAYRERSGVISTAQAHTHFLDSGPVSATLASTTVNLSRLKTTWDTSIYLILPPDRLSIHSRWLRVLVGSILQELARVEGQPDRDVLFLLDEAAVLGDLDVLRRFHALAAGYGVKFWLFFQDVSQMRMTYGSFWNSLVANSDLIQAFGVADSETSHLLRSRSRSILSDDDVLGIDGDHQLLLTRGCDPVVAGRCRYYTDREFKGQFAPNPMRTRSVARMQELERR